MKILSDKITLYRARAKLIWHVFRGLDDGTTLSALLLTGMVREVEALRRENAAIRKDSTRLQEENAVLHKQAMGPYR
jgi:hypothetical protein